ncbi:hypothetical protein ACXWRI_09355, partial [Streptococcus pyogenes]
ELLLQSFDDEDAEGAARALASPFIRHMDVEYSILARDIPLPRGIAAANKAGTIKNAAASYKSPNAGQSAEGAGVGVGTTAGEDEEEGSLC